MIRTVTGDMDAKDMGVTLCHEHFFMDLSRVRLNTGSTFADVDEIASEVFPMIAQGVETVVEVTTIDMGHDPKKLQELSLKTGLQIISSTGFYLQPYHPAILHDATEGDIVNIFINELERGIGDTRIKAGVIAEVASSKIMTDEERKVLCASAITSRETGFAVSTHTNKAVAEEKVDMMLSLGMSPGKLVIGHQDLNDDVDMLCRILDRGVNIGFDTVGKSAYLDDGTRAEKLQILIEKGYQKQIILSQDVSRREYFLKNGGYGYTAVRGQFTERLRKRGIPQEHLDDLFIYNPARIFDNARIG